MDDLHFAGSRYERRTIFNQELEKGYQYWSKCWKLPIEIMHSSVNAHYADVYKAKDILSCLCTYYTIYAKQLASSKAHSILIKKIV